MGDHYSDLRYEEERRHRAQPISGQCRRCRIEYATEGDRLDHEYDPDHTACFATLLARIDALETP